MNKNIKIAWISPDYFLDVDMPILPYVNNEICLDWIVISPIDQSRFSHKDVEDYCNLNKINLIHFSPKGRFRSRSFLSNDFKIFRKLKREEYDFVYTEYLNIYFILFLLCFFSRKKVIIGLHDVIDHSGFVSKIHHFKNKLIKRYFNNYQVFSQTQANYLSEKYGKSAFHIPLCLKHFGNAIPKESYTKENDVMFLFFGSIQSYKNLPLLIKAFEKLISSGYTGFKLTIAGHGKDWVNAKNKIRHPDFFNLKIGFVPNEEIANLFNDHHFIVLPYRDVTQSGPLMIALQYLTIPIVSNQKGFLECINNNINGLVFENENLDNLASVLLHAISLSSQQYNDMVDNLKLSANKYAPEVLANLYIDMFLTLTNKFGKK